jgi:hypothetical protein
MSDFVQLKRITTGKGGATHRESVYVNLRNVDLMRARPDATTLLRMGQQTVVVEQSISHILKPRKSFRSWLTRKGRR